MVTREHRQRAAEVLRLPARLNPWVETGEDMIYEDTWHPNAVAEAIARAERRSVWVVTRIDHDTSTGYPYESLVCICADQASGLRKANALDESGCGIWCGSSECRPHIGFPESTDYGFLVEEWCVLR